MAKKRLVRRRLAEDDIDAALVYYLNEAGPEIAADFVAQLEKLIASISIQPKLGSQRYAQVVMISGMRYREIKRFPYLVFYVEKENRIEVVRVLHSSRDITSLVNEIN